ncbi:unnamed protein product [Cyprideis torosa]|uniref:Uncharacterized protein n=1 Tax=Cyprideis torosa TaxID=163714 RepID=A0A7R8W835_9CRUS|nr:unnamed protein product [Cyprideis torosa]CAG0882799.1 unnamed protein product [Cyprideis torosa]
MTSNWIGLVGNPSNSIRLVPQATDGHIGGTHRSVPREHPRLDPKRATHQTIIKEQFDKTFFTCAYTPRHSRQEEWDRLGLNQRPPNSKEVDRGEQETGRYGIKCQPEWGAFFGRWNLQIRTPTTSSFNDGLMLLDLSLLRNGRSRTCAEEAVYCPCPVIWTTKNPFSTRTVSQDDILTLLSRKGNLLLHSSSSDRGNLPGLNNVMFILVLATFVRTGISSHASFRFKSELERFGYYKCKRFRGNQLSFQCLQVESADWLPTVQRSPGSDSNTREELLVKLERKLVIILKQFRNSSGSRKRTMGHFFSSFHIMTRKSWNLQSMKMKQALRSHVNVVLRKEREKNSGRPPGAGGVVVPFAMGLSANCASPMPFGAPVLSVLHIIKPHTQQCDIDCLSCCLPREAGSLICMLS